jgi:hypothetical protein
MMPRWEYLVAAGMLNDKTDKWQVVCGPNEYPNTQVMLNHLGDAGWELVGTVSFNHTSLKGLPRMPSTYTNYIEYYLKRQKV